MSVSRTAAAPAVAAPPVRADAVVAVLATVGTSMSLMQTLIIPLIPKLPALVHTSSSNAFWAITATLVAGAVANPVFGRLGDLFGKRRMMLVAVSTQLVGSVVGALATSIVPLVAGRALQGIGIAVIPLGVSIMRDLLPAERLVSAMAVMSSSLGVGGALGLPLAAIIAEKADWHVLFWISAGVGLVLVVLIARVIPESPVRATGGFDVPGAVLLSVGLLGLMLAISKGADWGWGSAATLGLLGGGALVLLLWGVFELRTDGPLIDLRTMSRRQVIVTNVASIALGFSMYAQSLVIPQLLQLPKETGYGLGQTLLATGLWMGPAGLAMMAISPVAGRLISARGPKTALIGGAAVVAAGYLLTLGLSGSPAGVLGFCIVISAGVGLSYAAMPTLIMRAVPAEEGASAIGLNTLMRAIGTSTASAVLGAVMSSMTVSLGPVRVPSHSGLRISFLIGAGTAVLSCLIACALPRHRAAAAPPRPAAPSPAAPSQRAPSLAVPRPAAPSSAAEAELEAERLSAALAVAGD
jgi:MFS family permease